MLIWLKSSGPGEASTPKLIHNGVSPLAVELRLLCHCCCKPRLLYSLLLHVVHILATVFPPPSPKLIENTHKQNSSHNLSSHLPHPCTVTI